MNKQTIKQRLEYLRSRIEAEDISYGEIAELQGLAEHIESGDVVLEQWAGIPEGGYSCPECGSKEFTEVVDGQWTNTYWEVKGRTIVNVGKKTDGNGDYYVECTECGEVMSSDFVEELFANNKIKHE